jgi:hypothetical protein
VQLGQPSNFWPIASIPAPASPQFCARRINHCGMGPPVSAPSSVQEQNPRQWRAQLLRAEISRHQTTWAIFGLGPRFLRSCISEYKNRSRSSLSAFLLGTPSSAHGNNQISTDVLSHIRMGLLLVGIKLGPLLLHPVYRSLTKFRVTSAMAM